MPTKNSIVTQIPLSRFGIDLNHSPQDLQPGYAVQMKNCYFRKGIQGRLGYTKHSTNEVVASKKIVGLHRFYYGTDSKQLIAVAGTISKYLNEGTGAWVNIQTGLTDSSNTHIATWAAVDKAYLANGVDAPYSWDGTTAATLAAFPVTTKMFLPYRDRLLFIEDGNPSYIRWTTGSYSDAAITTTAQAIRMVEGGAINVIAPHALADQQNGINAMVLVATGTAISLFSGTDLDPASGGFNARLDAVSSTVGILSPRSVVSTPAGTIFLGSDRQVYLLRYGAFTIEPIGKFIQSNNDDIDGIESIPNSEMTTACAEYDNGFYKLAIPVSGDNTPTTQYWLDVDNIYRNEEGNYGPWFGPMLGMPAVSMFVVQNGPGDDGRLISGNAGAEGFVWQANEPAVFADNSAAIDCRYQTHHQFFTDNAGISVSLNQYEIETKSINNPIVMSLQDTNIESSLPVSIVASNSGTLWDAANWDSFTWGSSGLPARKQGFFNVRFSGRQLSTVLDYSSSTDIFGLLAIRFEVTPELGVFAC